jgi:hypothetical protein
MKRILAAVAVVFVLILAYVGYQFWRLQQLAAKYANAKEIAAESIEKDANKWIIHMESVLAQPIDKVWEALRQPERSHEYIDAFKKSELKKEEGNTKVVEFEVQLLTLPAQTFVSQLSYDDARHTLTVKTLSGPQDQDSTYQLTALASDKTLLVMDGTAVDRITMPLPFSVQQGAMRELFVAQIRAIEKSIQAEAAKAKAKDAA